MKSILISAVVSLVAYSSAASADILMNLPGLKQIDLDFSKDLAQAENFTGCVVVAEVSSNYTTVYCNGKQIAWTWTRGKGVTAIPTIESELMAFATPFTRVKCDDKSDKRVVTCSYHRDISTGLTAATTSTGN